LARDCWAASRYGYNDQPSISLTCMTVAIRRMTRILQGEARWLLDRGHAIYRCTRNGGTGCLVLLVVAAAQSAAAAQVRTCPPITFGATIYQPTERDSARSPEDWRPILAELRRSGTSTLIVQWSSSDNEDYYPGRPSAHAVVPVLPNLMRAARKASMHLLIGLHQDTRWWSLENVSMPQLGSYFEQRLADLDARLPALKAALERDGDKSIIAWYITDEIDDQRWQSPDREAALTQYLAAVVQRLHRIAPQWPVALSAFANGAQDPHHYAAQLARIVRASGVRDLLLQDGIGAGKRSLAQATDTGRAIWRRLRGSGTHFGMIVEIFDFKPQAAAKSEAPATVPASILEILKRLSATAGIGDLPPTAFSSIHHLTSVGGDGAAERGRDWMALLSRCGRRHQDMRAQIGSIQRR
jgi:hypothetical protein